MLWVFVSEKKCMHNFGLLSNNVYIYLVRNSMRRFIVVCLCLSVCICLSICMAVYMSICQERECPNAQPEFCMFYLIVNIIKASLRSVYEFLQLFQTEVFLVSFCHL